VCSVTNTETSDILDQLFKAAGVERVISIDDEYADQFPVEDAIGLVEQLTDTVIAEVFAGHNAALSRDADIRNREVREIWEKAETSQRRTLMYALRTRSRPADHAAPEAIDEKTASVLPELFVKYGFAALSYHEWAAQKQRIILEPGPLCLILVDENFSKEGQGDHEGLAIVKEILATGRSGLICALLSHNYDPAKIHDDWTELCVRERLDKSKFVLISKKSLTTDLVGFARLVKLAILNGETEKLKTKALEILHAAEQSAQERVNAIDIYDFDQIVFRSSYREGVWEPDTLFRIFGLLHRDATRKIAKEDAELAKIIEGIRKISQIPTESESAPNYNTIELQRLELYEDGDYLNSHFTPVDTGDIFQKTGDSSKRYMLLGQPCDLMVRPNGKRRQKEAVLVEIVSTKTDNQDGNAELAFLDPDDDGKPGFVDFRKAQSVKLNLLDFCAFRSDGVSAFSVAGNCPDAVIPAWKARYKRISAEVAIILRNFEELRKREVTVAAAAMVARCSNENIFTPEIDLTTKALSYNVRRIRRLRQPRAAAILSRYAHFIARYAFDHDFGEYDRPEVLVAEAGGQNHLAAAEGGSDTDRHPVDHSSSHAEPLRSDPKAPAGPPKTDN
jgi:hypothetical protein